MFMLEMHDRLSSTPVVRQRIHDICKGHLQWVKQLNPQEALSSNLRVDGRLMDESALTDLPPNNPISIPSHIIKATQYLKVFNQMADFEFVCSWLDELITNWLKHLMQTKNRSTPTWQHSTDSEIPKYRLSDQVWIWKALKDIEELIENIERDQDRMAQSTLQTFLKIKAHLPSRSTRKSNIGRILDFTAEEMRKQNLRRFTLENDILKKRMLSVTRSTRETRFLLHSRDTILYYGMEWGFFPGEEAVWQQLINVQIQHDEDSNDEAQWDNPLRYGLALEMAGYNHQLDRNFLPLEMATHAKQVIIDSSSENGLFPGQLDAFSKGPVVFDRELFRDFYFHVGFEIPYILLRTAKKTAVVKLDSETIMKNAPGSPIRSQPRQDEVHLRGGVRVSRSQSRVRDQSPNFNAAPDGATQGYISLQPDGRAFVVQRTLKRQNPYGRLMDLNNIVDIPEEWLYRYPDFLDFKPPKTLEEVNQILRKAPPRMNNSSFESVVEGKHPPSDSFHVIIEDVRKGRKYRKWDPEEKSHSEQYFTYTDLWRRLREKRITDWSKKRLLYLTSVDYTLAAMFYVASPEAERMHMAQFFDRHAKVDANYLYDDTTVSLNTWVTEVHFRFFQARNSEAPELNQQSVRQLKFQPCRIFGRDAYLVDAVISFRIVGDYFDRYWTCHLIQETQDGRKATLDVKEYKEDTHWQQRKILELLLFNRILEEVCNSLDDILKHIEKPRSSSSDATERYFSKDRFEDRKPEDLRESFQILVILKNNVTRLQSLIEQWTCRESSQGRERPRWTPNDEQKYRKSIKQKQAQLEDHIREIKARNARIEFMITLVTNAEDAIRSKKSLKEAENITVFTYVTVFFLPVGLAVSVFSMNGTPDHKVVTYMVITATVAFLITASILWCMLSHLIATRVSNILDYIHGQSLPQTVRDQVSTDQHFNARPLSPLPNLQPTKSLQLFKRRRKSRGRLEEDLEDQKLYEE
jgi:predicted membrane channel-forming protein YqfA (hemolysin III family)